MQRPAKVFRIPIRNQRAKFSYENVPLSIYQLPKQVCVQQKKVKQTPQFALQTNMLSFMTLLTLKSSRESSAS